jgi:uncharacterized SAM-binding protein YcdF (DUF218 family)
MASFIAFVCSVGGLVAWLLVVAAWIAWRPQSRGARRVLTIIAVVYLLASVYAVPLGVSRILVRDYGPFTAADAPTGHVAIVLLSGSEGFTRDWDGRWHAVFPGESADRIFEAARISALMPDADIISSGGPTAENPAAPTSAAAMRDELVRLGVPASRVILEDRSLTTYDEAVLIAPMLRARRIDHVVLVTSDIHMRRSLATFRGAGIDATPAIARAHALSPSWRWNWLPGTPGLEFTGAIVHEFAGLVGYGLRGWLRPVKMPIVGRGP